MPNYIRIKQINQNELSGFVEGSLGESVALVTAAQNIVSGIFESYNDVSGNFVLRSGNQTISGFKTFVANDNYIVISGTSDSEGLIKSLTSNLTIEGANSNYGINFADDATYIHGNTEINNTLYVQSTGIFLEGINIGGGTINAQIKLTDNAQGTYINIIPSDGTINFQLEDDNTNLAFDLTRISNGSTETIAIDREVVHKTSDETISGIKTFASRPTVNGTGVLLSGEAAALPTTIVYTTGNQIISGIKTFAEGVDLNNIDYLNLSGVDVTITSGVVALTNRPTVNGTGVLLSGEASAITLPTTIVYTTGDQTIGGVKTFDDRPNVNGTGILLSGEVSTFKFTGDLNVSLSNNKTFGRYSNGQTIPASGKTLPEFFDLVLIEPISPTVSLNSNTAIGFNQIPINNILNASNTVNSLNSSIQTGYIEYRRGNVGSYTNLIGNQSSSIVYTHSLTDTSFNANPFNYRYVVTDTVGGTNTSTLTITPSSYIAPTITNVSIGADAELGNISTTLAVTINRNSANVNLTSYQLQYQSIINGTTSAWTNIGTFTSISGPSSVVSQAHNDITLLNASSISYRIQIIDQYQTTTLNLGTRSFFYRNYLGYRTNTVLTLAEIQALSSSVLSNSKARTVSSVNPGAGNYVYYCYRAAEGDLTSITDGLEQFIGSFEKLPADVAGTNSNGASVTYRVYKSNATNAFLPNTTLIFS